MGLKVFIIKSGSNRFKNCDGISQSISCLPVIWIASCAKSLTRSQWLKKQISAEVTRALNDFTCNCTSNESLSPVEEAVQRLEEKLEVLAERLDSHQDLLHKDGLSRANAADSCSAILEKKVDVPSGHYWVKNGAGLAHRVYCDMTRLCGGVTGGWVRVAKLNMSNSDQQCPNGLRQRTDNNYQRSCAPESDQPTCSSVIYQTYGITYSKVCGKVHAHNGLTLDGFHNLDIDSNYVDGVSLTHGSSPRHHIWSFAWVWHCDCSGAPSFVQNDYFCDFHNSPTLSQYNPMWDGYNCGNNDCCNLHNPPLILTSRRRTESGLLR